MRTETERNRILAAMIAGMTDLDHGDRHRHDAAHFIKVHNYARTIGILEELDEETQFITECEAIVHDISIPACRAKYGNASGKNQEAESAEVLEKFLPQFPLTQKEQERIIFVVSHHHTYSGVDGIDWQILLEADFLVNADEDNLTEEPIVHMREQVYRTESGKKLLNRIFSLANQEKV